MKLSFWAKFGVLMLALAAGECLALLVQYRSQLGPSPSSIGKTDDDSGRPSIDSQSAAAR
jgi:hypothetical protein